MIKYFIFILNLLNPLEVFQINLSTYKNLSSSSLIAMVPPKGSFLSKQATNKLNPPGCSITSSTATKPDGSLETRETLTCTKVTIEKPSGEKVRKPISKEIKKFILAFFK
uniref:Uncharacterized protein n=1 Tax=Agarophyton chilense TaxID=2510777 RepID=O49033_AGACH|nr:ORF16 [Agarophyton chilense]